MERVWSVQGTQKSQEGPTARQNQVGCADHHVSAELL